MKEYLIIAVASVSIVYAVDVRFKTHVFKRTAFWKLQIIAALLLTFVDHFSAVLPIVIYDPDIILGFRIREIPIENYIFGFSMLALNIVLFEKLKNKPTI